LSLPLTCCLVTCRLLLLLLLLMLLFFYFNFVISANAFSYLVLLTTITPQNVLFQLQQFTRHPLGTCLLIWKVVIIVWYMNMNCCIENWNYTIFLHIYVQERISHEKDIRKWLNYIRQLYEVMKKKYLIIIIVYLSYGHV